MVLERFEYSYMNDIDNQLEETSAEANSLFEDGKINSQEYQGLVEKIASAKAELDYYKTHFRRFDCSMDQGKIIKIDRDFFQLDNMNFKIWNLISESVGNLYFQAKPVLISCDKIKRRALEIAVEVKGDPKDLILIEIFCDGHDIRSAIREIFLGKRSATAIFLFEDIRSKISEDFQLFIGYRSNIKLEKLEIMKNTIEHLRKGKTESLIPNRKAAIIKSSLIPTRTQKPQKSSLPNKKLIQQPIPQRSIKKNIFSLKQLETGISRKYGEKTEWMKKEPEQQIENDDSINMNESKTKEVPQRNYNEYIYEENFPL